MRMTRAANIDLRGWTVIGLRASAQQAALRRAARAAGADFISACGLRLRPVTGATTRAALLQALACPLCVFTSPSAVRFAAQMVRIDTPHALAIGSGSSAALRRAGVARITAPDEAMHSEGLLALAELNPPPSRVGLVTAPGGRGEIARVLAARGAALQVAEVYRREQAVLRPSTRQAIAALPTRAAVLISSAEALRNVHAQLETAAQQRLCRAVALCASERTREVAIELGFSRCLLVGSTRPNMQLQVLAVNAKSGAFG